MLHRLHPQIQSPVKYWELALEQMNLGNTIQPSTTHSDTYRLENYPITTEGVLGILQRCVNRNLKRHHRCPWFNSLSLCLHGRKIALSSGPAFTPVEKGVL
jgi:hypothetical protein